MSELTIVGLEGTEGPGMGITNDDLMLFGSSPEVDPIGADALFDLPAFEPIDIDFRMPMQEPSPVSASDFGNVSITPQAPVDSDVVPGGSFFDLFGDGDGKVSTGEAYIAAALMTAIFGGLSGYMQGESNKEIQKMRNRNDQQIAQIQANTSIQTTEMSNAAAMERLLEGRKAAGPAVVTSNGRSIYAT